MKENDVIRDVKPGAGMPIEAPNPRRAVTFVILLTLASSESRKEPLWRWRVRSVESGEEANFLRVGDALAFIAATSGHAEPQ